MNAEERKRLRELSDKATPGPWEHSPTDLWACITQSEFVLLKHEGTDRSVVLADAAFIAAARSAVPALLDALDASDWRVRELETTLAEQDKSYRSMMAERNATQAESDELHAENAALKARVAALEEVRKAARGIWECTEGMAIPPLTDTVDALKSALDRAGEP